MKTITGGMYNGREYSCMYDPNDIIYRPDRYDAGSGLIGLVGTVSVGMVTKKDRPAMLWFTGKDVVNPVFVRGEKYFPKIGRTLSEIGKDMTYSLDDFEPSDTQGWEMEGNVIYRGNVWNICCSLMDDESDSWEEAVIADLVRQL